MTLQETRKNGSRTFGYTTHGVEQILRMRIAQVGSQKAFAAEHGLSIQYVNYVLRHRREPGKKILDALHLEKRIRFYAAIPIREFIQSIQP